MSVMAMMKMKPAGAGAGHTPRGGRGKKKTQTKKTAGQHGDIARSLMKLPQSPPPSVSNKHVYPLCTVCVRVCLHECLASSPTLSAAECATEEEKNKQTGLIEMGYTS